MPKILNTRLATCTSLKHYVFWLLIWYNQWCFWIWSFFRFLLRSCSCIRSLRDCLVIWKWCLCLMSLQTSLRIRRVVEILCDAECHVVVSLLTCYMWHLMPSKADRHEGYSIMILGVFSNRRLMVRPVCETVKGDLSCSASLDPWPLTCTVDLD